MKKFALILLLCLGFILAFSATSYANEEDGLIELYPYNQQACLDATNACTQTKLGNSNWQFVFHGHRYHIVRGSARYVTEFEDGNADGFIDATEMTAMAWNAFASLIINDTDEGVILKTANARTDLTTVVHRIYTYFDETGQLVMMEDQILTYYIFNDGTVEAPDWRLATDAEKTAYDAADPKPANMRVTHIRMKLDETDSDGYKLEPLTFITWRNADIPAETPKTEWSTVVDGDPELVHIPAGWTVISFGTLDRDNSNPKTTSFIKSLPYAMLDETVDPLELNYDDQPAMFAGLTALDDDLVSPGINVVVEYEGEFDLPNTVSASWLNMFDENDKIINSTEKLDYQVVISKDDVDLETITFVYNEGTDDYTPSGPVTSIDTDVFGSGYKASYEVMTPLGAETVQTLDIVIGVMPPRFAGVENRYGNEGIMIDLMQGITADDGYGNDKTDDIMVTYPEGFNPYNPTPGVYEIELEFIHNIFIPGVAPTVDLNGQVFTYYGGINPVVAGTNDLNLHLYTDVTLVKALTLSWTSAIAVVGADGLVDQVLSRANNKLTNEANPLPTTDAGNTNVVDPAAWQAALTLEEGGFIVVVRGTTSIPENAVVKGLAYNVPVSYVIEKADFDYDIVTETMYTMTIDDVTAPVLLTVADEYEVEIGRFDSVNDLILSNVTAFDNYDAREDVAIYVSNNGGLNLNTAGTYTVEVTAEDIAGNASTATFDVVLVEPTITQSFIEALIAAGTLDEEAIQALIDADMLTEAQVITLITNNTLSQADVQALIDAAVEEAIDDLRDELTAETETGCGNSGTNVSLASIIIPLMSIFALAGIAFLKRH